MTFIVFLRAVSDAGFYFFFASPISGLFGARAFALAAGLALDCAALTAGYLLRGRGARYLALALPVSFLLFGAAGWAERAALAAHMAYVWRLLRSEEYEPTWDHEAALFSRFWKISLPVLILFPVFSGLTETGTRTLETVLLPAAVVTMTTLVLLTRALRHDRDVYVQPRRQLADAAVFALLLALAALLGSGPVLGGAWYLLKTAFRYVAAPLLSVLMWLGWKVLAFVLRLLARIFPEAEFEMPTLPEGNGVPREPVLPENVEPAEGSAFLRTLLILVGAALLAYLAYRLLRMLLLRGPQAVENGERPVERVSLAPDGEPRTKRPSRAPVEQVRREYRRFLRLCERRGIDLRRGDTTLSVERKAAARAVPRSAGTLRDIYIAARYGERADPEAAELAGRIAREIKRDWRERVEDERP